MRSKWKIFLNCYNFIKGQFFTLSISQTRFNYKFLKIKRDGKFDYSRSRRDDSRFPWSIGRNRDDRRLRDRRLIRKSEGGLAGVLSRRPGVTEAVRTPILPHHFSEADRALPLRSIIPPF